MWQKFMCAGYLTDKPVMRYTPQGQAVMNFTIGINEYKDKTLWMKVTMWGEKAEKLVEYLEKGRGVLLEGRLDCADGGNPETYVSKKDGQTYSSFTMTAFNLKFLPRGGSKEPAQNSPTQKMPWEQ